MQKGYDINLQFRVLWCTVVYCGVLWFTVVYCGVLWCTVVYCGVRTLF